VFLVHSYQFHCSHTAMSSGMAVPAALPVLSDRLYCGGQGKGMFTTCSSDPWHPLHCLVDLR
jgi:hypothetical protein